MLDIGKMGQSFEQFLISELSQNSLYEYIISLAILVLGVLFVAVSKRFILRKIERWVDSHGRYGRVDRKLGVLIIHSLLSLLYIVPFYWSFGLLTFSKAITKTISVFFLLVFTYFFIRLVSSIIVFLLDAALRNSGKDDGSHKGAGALVPIVRTLVWAVGITFLLDNLGFKVSSIVAGLGIMGVAVGLAGQAILADFFSYIVILLDQPFAIGDTVNLGTATGTVVHTGIKTTRIQLSTGEMLICPNGELTKARVGNQEPMFKRVRVFTFTVAYNTPLEKITDIPSYIKSIAQSATTGIEIDRVHCAALTDVGVQFEVAYSVLGKDLSVLMDAQHILNMGILEIFALQNIAFASPLRWVKADEAKSIIAP